MRNSVVKREWWSEREGERGRQRKVGSEGEREEIMEGRDNLCVCVIAEGVIVEQFCYKLGLILAHIAALSPDHHAKV